MASFGIATIPFLSRRAVLGVSRFLGRWAYRFSVQPRRIAMANLDIVFGDTLPPARKCEIVQESFCTLALVALDLFWFSRDRERRIREWVKLDASYAHYKDNSPVVGVTAHLGNWEAMGLASALNGQPQLSVAAVLGNPVLNRMINRTRSATGQKIIPQEGALRALIRALKTGGRTALLLDQNTLPRDGAEFVPLFGLPALMSRAASGLAENSGAVVVFGCCPVDASGRYTVFVSPPLRPVPGETFRRGMMLEIARQLETVVKKYPGQWVWMYKRWKYIPDGYPSDGFPFYARLLDNKER